LVILFITVKSKQFYIIHSSSLTLRNKLNSICIQFRVLQVISACTLLVLKDINLPLRCQRLKQVEGGATSQRF